MTTDDDEIDEDEDEDEQGGEEAMIGKDDVFALIQSS